MVKILKVHRTLESGTPNDQPRSSPPVFVATSHLKKKSYEEDNPTPAVEEHQEAGLGVQYVGDNNKKSRSK